MAQSDPDEQVRNARHASFQPTPCLRWVSERDFEFIKSWLTERGDQIENALPGTFVVDAAPGQKRGQHLRGYLVRTEDLWVTEILDANWEVGYRIVSDADGAPTIGEIRVYPAEPPTDLRAGTPELSFVKLVTLTGQWAAEFVGFRARVPRGGLSARALRSITARRALSALDNSLRLAEVMFEVILEGRSVAAKGVMGWLQSRMETLAGEAPRKTGDEGASRGRPAAPDVYYARLAEQYVNELHKQNPKPLETVALQRGEDYSTTRSALYRARKRGLLTSPGRSGVTMGELTPMARRLLTRQRRKSTKRRPKVTRPK